MKNPVQSLIIAAGLLGLCGCASSSIKQSWKSPAYAGGPVQKVAVVAVDERGVVRLNLENRFVRDLGSQGQAAVATYEQLGLPEIKADKEAAAARLRASGEDVVLIVRLVDQATYSRDVQATPALWVPTASGYGSYYWHDYYSVAYVDMGTTWSSTRQKLYLDSSLFDLKTGQRLWSALTVTLLTDTSDKLVEADALVAKVVQAMRKDGVVR